MFNHDEIWDVALETLTTEGEFEVSELPIEWEKRHTARRVLRDMEDRGWLSRESRGAKVWKPGEKFESIRQS